MILISNCWVWKLLKFIYNYASWILSPMGKYIGKAEFFDASQITDQPLKDVCK